MHAYSIIRFHESVKDTDIEVGSWIEISPSLECTREINFTSPINFPGLSSTKSSKRQRYKYYKDMGLILCSTIKTEGVPAADTFIVEDLLIVR